MNALLSSKIIKSALGSGALGLLFIGLSGCTTVEGTNAFADGETFEREVLLETWKGIGLDAREKKKDVTSERAPLVLPKNANVLPIPTRAANNATLPQDSKRVKLDTSRLTENEIRLLRGARVVDLKDKNGRSLTVNEANNVAQRFRDQRAQYRLAGSKGNRRSLILPPERYFTRVGGEDLICLTAKGDLVPLTSPLCPPEIRAALQ